jgi:hypothetical protein
LTGVSSHLDNVNSLSIFYFLCNIDIWFDKRLKRKEILRKIWDLNIAAKTCFNYLHKLQLVTSDLPFLIRLPAPFFHHHHHQLLLNIFKFKTKIQKHTIFNSFFFLFSFSTNMKQVEVARAPPFKWKNLITWNYFPSEMIATQHSHKKYIKKNKWRKMKNANCEYRRRFSRSVLYCRLLWNGQKQKRIEECMLMSNEFIIFIHDDDYSIEWEWRLMSRYVKDIRHFIIESFRKDFMLKENVNRGIGKDHSSHELCIKFYHHVVRGSISLLMLCIIS